MTSTLGRICTSARRASTPMWKKEARAPPPESASPTRVCLTLAFSTDVSWIISHDPTSAAFRQQQKRLASGGRQLTLHERRHEVDGVRELLVRPSRPRPSGGRQSARPA